MPGDLESAGGEAQRRSSSPRISSPYSPKQILDNMIRPSRLRGKVVAGLVISILLVASFAAKDHTVCAFILALHIIMLTNVSDRDPGIRSHFDARLQAWQSLPRPLQGRRRFSKCPARSHRVRHLLQRHHSSLSTTAEIPPPYPSARELHILVQNLDICCGAWLSTTNAHSVWSSRPNEPH